ncbi:hypothetical protein WP1263 [Wolbachia endosymbiont of Culex quinquefasciatus Pel]|nr:hypothetical protein WP1263 [Wolbachia endosymbiont of Culex quinquefasciatus Pel]
MFDVCKKTNERTCFINFFNSLTIRITLYYLSSSVQIKRQKHNAVVVLFLIFCTMCILFLYKTSSFLTI